MAQLKLAWNRREGTLKRLVLSHLEGSWYAASTVLVFLLLVIVNQSFFVSSLRRLHLVENKPAYGVVLGIISSAVVALLATKKAMVSWFRKRIFPVNLRIGTHLEAYSSYYSAVSSRIRGLLPDELREVWNTDSDSNRQLITVSDLTDLLYQMEC